MFVTRSLRRIQVEIYIRFEDFEAIQRFSVKPMLSLPIKNCDDYLELRVEYICHFVSQKYVLQSTDDKPSKRLALITIKNTMNGLSSVSR